MKTAAALVVTLLERSCSLVRHWHSCQLAGWSLTLDDRWGTQRWTVPDPSTP